MIAQNVDNSCFNVEMSLKLLRNYWECDIKELDKNGDKKPTFCITLFLIVFFELMFSPCVESKG